MTAYFESGIFTENKPAWHGLGIVSEQDALTRREVFERLPLLASPVDKIPVFGAFEVDGAWQTVDLPDSFILVRREDKKTWGYQSIVSKVYEVLQNDELFDFAETICEQSGAVWKTAGTLKDGRIAWGLLQLGDDITIGGLSDEVVQRYLLVSNTFDKSGGVAACATKVRVVCSNTYAAAIGAAPAVYRFRHTGSMDGRLAQARGVLQIAFNHDAEFTKLCESWLSVNLEERDFMGLVRAVEPMTEEAVKSDRVRHTIEERRSDLVTIYRDSPNLQNVAGTKYAAMQAVIEWEQHYRFQRRDQEGKLLHLIRPSQTYVPKAMEVLASI